MSKIMIIDDEQQVRELVARFLEKRGHKTVQVSDGSHAMKAIRAERPDLIILDVMMPELDGAALGYHLKFHSEFARIPIILLTGLADKPYLARDIAADYFMTKPFDGEKLAFKVEEILASGEVKVAKKPTEDLTRGRKEKRYKLKVAAVATAVFAVCMAVLYTISAPQSLATDFSGAAAGGASAISSLSDTIFIYAVPVALALLVYIATLLKNAGNNNASGNERPMRRV